RSRGNSEIRSANVVAWVRVPGGGVDCKRRPSGASLRCTFPGRAPRFGRAQKEAPMQEYKLYIDGQFCDAEGGRTVDSINPATEEPWARIARATRKDTQPA